MRRFATSSAATPSSRPTTSPPAARSETEPAPRRAASPAHTGALHERLDKECGTAGNRVFYFAVPPSAISILVDRLGHRRDRWRGWTRLIIEKPFGSDRESARRLNQELNRFFEEREIFRIDHYLGKETVQN